MQKKTKMVHNVIGSVIDVTYLLNDFINNNS